MQMSRPAEDPLQNQTNVHLMLGKYLPYKQLFSIQTSRGPVINDRGEMESLGVIVKILLNARQMAPFLLTDPMVTKGKDDNVMGE